jgi:hypothetical protein
MMLANFGIRDLAPQRLQPGKRTLLVGTHEPAETGDVRGENGGQLAFDAFRGQAGLLNRMGRMQIGSGTHSNGKRESCHSLSVRRPSCFTAGAAPKR